MGGAIFQPRILAALAAALCTLFAASLLLTGAGGRSGAGAAFGANSYSRSAIGHLLFHDLLRHLGHKTARSEHQPLAMLGRNGVLILAEPSGTLTGEENRNKLLTADTILLVLPKWNVRPSERRSGWIEAAELAPALRVQAVLDAAVNGGDVVRVAPPASYRKTIAAADPTIQGTVQLIRNSRLTPLVAAPEGILLGELRQGTRRIWVLADPDPIENHGIAKGDNAAFARDMVAALLAGRNGTLVFDETIHGFRQSPPNLLKFLYEFPLNLVLIQMLIALALLLWAAMGRFGAPQALPRRLEAGRHALIGNAASLLDHAGHHAAILHRYITMTVQDAGKALRAPPRLYGAALTTWISQKANARGIDTKPLAGLDQIAAESRNLPSLLTAAQALYRWRKDLPNGISRRLDDHPRYPGRDPQSRHRPG